MRPRASCQIIRIHTFCVTTTSFSSNYSRLMSLKRNLLPVVIAWIALITALHLALNLRPRWFAPRDTARSEKYRIGFLPVTCHLTCPVTDFINKEMTGEGIYDPVRF